MKKIIFAFIAIVAFVNTGSAQTKNPVVQNLSSERFKAIIAYDKVGTVIDLRTNEEITKTGTIAGAVQIDFLAKDAEKQIDKLDKHKTYYIYCASGGRSSDAAEYMEKQGFDRVYTLQHGITEWLQKGFPVEKK
ncbi:MAG TPA: rhodanese-like domain-containing protein [Bacteroidia bacterium]|jgi:rhodanese-related sulfurtransferase